MSGTRITFYGGMNEIGGNKFLLEDKGTRVFLDFGLQMGLHGRYYDMMMAPRDGSALGDLFEFELLPRIHGIYRKDYTRHLSHGPNPGWFEDDYRSDDYIDGVLLTHAHVDHCDYLHYLRPNIPVYCTEATKLIMQALQDTGAGSKDLTRYREHFAMRLNSKNEPGWAVSGAGRHPRDERDRNLSLIKPYKKYRIDSIEFEALPVDHSLPGACAFIIHTSAGSIGYTGDLRFHGRRRTETERFLAECGGNDLDYLLCEGTRVDVRSSPTEEDVEVDAGEIIRGTERLSVVSYPVRDLDRFVSLYNAAVGAGREMVIDFKQAYLLAQFEDSSENSGTYPRLDDPHIRLFLPRMGKGLAGSQNDEWDERLLRKDYASKWKQELLDGKAAHATYREIASDPKRYVLYCSDFGLQQLVDIRPGEGSSYIHSSTEPFSDEMELDHNRIRRWLAHFKLIASEKSWITLHVSGHGTGDQIQRVVREAGARRLVPIHTQRADRFRYWHDDVVASQNGGCIGL